MSEDNNIDVCSVWVGDLPPGLSRDAALVLARGMGFGSDVHTTLVFHSSANGNESATACIFKFLNKPAAQNALNILRDCRYPASFASKGKKE